MRTQHYLPDDPRHGVGYFRPSSGPRLEVFLGRLGRGGPRLEPRDAVCSLRGLDRSLARGLRTSRHQLDLLELDHAQPLDALEMTSAEVQGGKIKKNNWSREGGCTVR